MASRTTATRSSTEVPRLYADARGAARARSSAPAPTACCRRSCGSGSWIGGDRDGNPFVTARDAALRDPRAGGASRSRTISTKIHRLGGELSLSTRLVQPTPALIELARSGARRRIRTAQDEPYRQALIGIYARARRDGAARSPATCRRARRTRSWRRTRRRRRFAPTSTRSRASLATHGATPLAAGRLDAAAARRRRVRLPSRRARPAAERRRARGRRRRAARARRRGGRLRARSPRPRASRCSRASSRARGCCIRRTSAIRRARASELAILRRRGRHPSRGSARPRCRTT